MSTSSGPNSSAESNLVFAFDMADTKNSYLGEPTVNIRAGADLDGSYSASGRVIDNSGSLTAPDGSKGWSSISSPGAPGDYRIAKFPYNSLSEGSTYTFSLELYNPGPNALEIFVDGNLGQPGTTIPLGYSKYTYTYTVTRSGGGTWSIFFGTENKTANIEYNPERLIYFKNYQVEEKSHVTPYTADSRSLVEGLLDLTRSNDIDLTGAVYDLNADLVFDGTDTFIQTNYLSDLVGEEPTGISFELVVNAYDLSTYSGMMGDYVGPSGTGFAIKKASLTDDRFEFRTYAVGAIPRSQSVIVPGLYYHVVCTWDNTGNIQIFINGILETVDPNAGRTWNHGLGLLRIGDCYNSMGVPAEFNGEIPVVKIYNKALTAEEVQKNFKVIQKRFNIE